jgi:hypothetical protein
MWVDLALLLVLGMVAGLALRWSLPLLLQEPAEQAALRRWGDRHGWRIREDGPNLQVIGGHSGRSFSFTLLPGPPLQLLVGVDCAAMPRSSTAEGASQVQDGTLVSRWTAPPTSLFEADRLDALLEELAGMAQSLEETQPLPIEDEDHS